MDCWMSYLLDILVVSDCRYETDMSDIQVRKIRARELAFVKEARTRTYSHQSLKRVVRTTTKQMEDVISYLIELTHPGVLVPRISPSFIQYDVCSVQSLRFPSLAMRI
jgi:lambda repressor-like predicted transcriptional regulator